MKIGVDCIGASVGVMILQDNKVLLAKRLEDNGVWCMPGGKIDYGETIVQAAIRETKEECDLDVENIEVIGIHESFPENKHFVNTALLVTKFSGTPKVMEPDTLTDWSWHDLDNLPENMFFASKKVIEHYKTKKIYVE